MKRKTTEKILRGKFTQFLKSIKDKKVQNLVRENTIITGGSIVSLLLGEDINDFDIYFTNKETVIAVCEYYKKIVDTDDKMQNFKIEDLDTRVRLKISSSGISEGNKKTKHRYYPIIVTDNAITLSNQVQIIVRFFGDAENIHQNYDFEHTKNYWLSKNGKLYLKPEAVECILNKELRYTGSLYPLASLFRLKKFLSKGWTISAGDIFKIGYQVNDLQLQKPEVLYDQLIGVDIYYFNRMIERIQEDLEKGVISNDERMSNDYLTDLIDEIFHDSGDFDINDFDNINEELENNG